MPPDRRFFAILWSSFLAINGPFFGVGGVGVSLCAWVFAKDATISLPAASVCFGVMLVLCTTLGHAYYTAHRAMMRAAPKVVCVMKPAAPHHFAIAIIVLEASDLFSPQVQVTVFELSGGVERCVGVGRVFSIQEDGRAQVVLERAYEGTADLLESLFSGRQGAVDSIRVRPHVFAHDLDNLPARRDAIPSTTHTTPAGVA